MPPPIDPPEYIPFSVLVSNVLQVVLFIAGVLAVLFLLIAGIQYITAGGDPVKTAAARSGIVNAIIGIIIILLAFSIMIWIQNVIKSGQL